MGKKYILKIFDRKWYIFMFFSYNIENIKKINWKNFLLIIFIATYHYLLNLRLHSQIKLFFLTKWKLVGNMTSKFYYFNRLINLRTNQNYKIFQYFQNMKAWWMSELKMSFCGNFFFLLEKYFILFIHIRTDFSQDGSTHIFHPFSCL